MHPNGPLQRQARLVGASAQRVLELKDGLDALGKPLLAARRSDAVPIEKLIEARPTPRVTSVSRDTWEATNTWPQTYVVVRAHKGGHQIVGGREHDRLGVAGLRGLAVRALIRKETKGRGP